MEEDIESGCWNANFPAIIYILIYRYVTHFRLAITKALTQMCLGWGGEGVWGVRGGGTGQNCPGQGTGQGTGQGIQGTPNPGKSSADPPPSGEIIAPCDC